MKPLEPWLDIPLSQGSRLWSLWDMLRFHSDKVVRGIDQITTLLQTIRLIAPPGAGVGFSLEGGALDRLKANVEALHKEVTELGLPVSGKATERLLELVVISR